MSEVQIFSGTSSAIVLLTYCAMTCIALLGIFVVLYLSKNGSKKNAGMLDELVLDERQKNRDGYTSVTDKSRFLGAIGVCATDLRPAGTITVEGSTALNSSRSISSSRATLSKSSTWTAPAYSFGKFNS